MTYRVNTGTIWSAFLANASLTPINDGNLDIPGHGPKIVDDWLSDDINQIKNRFYYWYNQFTMSSQSGLILNVTEGVVVTAVGDIDVPAKSMSIPANTSRWIIVLESGIISNVAINNLPSTCFILGRVTTSAESITGIIDLRDPRAYHMSVYSIPVESTFSPGDLKVTLRSNPDAGWLVCDGSYVDPNVYGLLFDVLGYRFGQSGSLFRLPPADIHLLSTAIANDVGNLVGSNTATLTLANMPRHNHAVNQQGHTHVINDTGHDHGRVNFNHTHNINQSPHTHNVGNKGRHNHTVRGDRGLAVDNSNGFGLNLSDLSVQGGTVDSFAFGGNTTDFQNAVPSIDAANANITISSASSNATIPSRRTGITINPSNINVSIQNSGENKPFSIQPSAMKCSLWIKT